MSFKKTSAFIKGSWWGIPDESNFDQDPTVFASPEEFIDYANDDLNAMVTEYVNAGSFLGSDKTMSADGKVLISTKEYVDQATWEAFSSDERWAAENAVTKKYDVEEAPTPGDVGTFDEDNRIYYHSSAHLF